jgi:saccharopine dehydrogenase-like NADP-dependent oxidoreductase
VAERLWSAIQITTASGICAVLDIVLSSPGQYQGFVAQEQFRLADVLANRFGKFYAHGGTNKESAERVARGQTGHQRKNGGKQ